MSWGIDPVTGEFICFGCVCDLTTCVISPNFEVHPFKLELSSLAAKAGIKEDAARIVWLKHLQNSIESATQLNQAGPTAGTDAQLVAMLLKEHESDPKLGV